MNTAKLTHPAQNPINLSSQLAEDPYREPPGKETGITLAGDKDVFQVSSFKRSVYGKLLENPSFEVTRLNVLDSNGQESTLETRQEVLEQPELRVIGVTGQMPVGTLNISGTPRKSNSHARIVK